MYDEIFEIIRSDIFFARPVDTYATVFNIGLS